MPEAGVVRVMVNVAVPAASFTIMSSITNCGMPSLSIIVATALAGNGFAPLTGVVVRINVSLPSVITSSKIGTRNCIEVARAGMVTSPATGSQVVPPSSEYSNVASAPVSFPMVAGLVPEPLKLGVNTTGLALGLLKFTVNTACVLVPSITPAAAVTERIGAGSLSAIRAVPVVFGLLVVLGAVLVTVSVKFSFGSSVLSLVVGVRTSTLVEPAGIVAVVASTHVAPLS